MGKNSPFNKKVLDEHDDNFTGRTVESWLSDTSGTFEHEEDILVSFLLALEFQRLMA
jgi:hypothetical protein